MLGLLAHLWGKEFFKGLGDACEGSMMVDVETEKQRHLKWVIDYSFVMVGERNRDS